MRVKKIGIKAITSTHIGAGRGDGNVDLPIVREKVSNYPYLPGSALKGVMRDKREGEPNFTHAFGSRRTNGAETTFGSLIFADAKLLALPIRSYFGTFALVSCPTIIWRLFADLRSIGDKIETPNVPNLKEAEIAVTTNSPLVYAEKQKRKACLEDVDFDVVDDKVDELGQRLVQTFPIFGEAIETNVAGQIKRFALVSDEAFAFLCETGTEITAHIRIDPETGVVQKGALWNQETLPPETFLYSFVFCDRIYRTPSKTNEQTDASQVVPKITPKELLDSFCPTNEDVFLQFGGKASTGLGRCLCRFMEAQQ